MEKKFDKTQDGSLATRGEWFKEMEAEYKKKADYIKEHNLFDDFNLVNLTESGLSILIYQALDETDDVNHTTWAIGCMSHGKHIDVENVRADFVIKMFRSFADQLEKDPAYFSKEPIPNKQ